MQLIFRHSQSLLKSSTLRCEPYNSSIFKVSLPNDSSKVFAWLRTFPEVNPLKVLAIIIVCAACCSGLFAQTQESCPAGTEDMLNYFTMGYPNRLSHYMGPGNANPVYNSISPDLGSKFAKGGQFLWIKSSIGYPWDIKMFDGNYVYDRTTELSWTDPTTFKRFNRDLPMSRRCVPMKSSGGTVKIPSSATNYTFYANCLPTQTQNLGYVINNISAPVMVSTGGNLGSVRTRYFTYKYSCNSSYEACSFEEVFSLGYGVGLYDWKYYVNQGGTLALSQHVSINRFTSGAATPYLPCTSSYQ